MGALVVRSLGRSKDGLRGQRMPNLLLDIGPEWLFWGFLRILAEREIPLAFEIFIVD